MLPLGFLQAEQCRIRLVVLIFYFLAGAQLIRAAITNLRAVLGTLQLLCRSKTRWQHTLEEVHL